MPAESVIERLRRLAERLRDPMFAEFVEVSENDVLGALRVAEAADELYALRIRVTPEEFDSAEGSRAMAKLDLAVRALREGVSSVYPPIDEHVVTGLRCYRCGLRVDATIDGLGTDCCYGKEQPR